MAPKHPYQDIKIPENAPFELRPSPVHGWGAFATRRIEPDAVIFVERPLFVIRRKHLSELTEADFATALRALPATKKKALKSLLPPGAARLDPSAVEPVFFNNEFNIGTAASPTHGLYLVHSRFNHSCLPNAKLPSHIENDTITSFATRAIDPGEEIRFCYSVDFEAQTALERRSVLRFTCCCEACLPGTPFQQCSDLRRQLVRGLEYLIHGFGLDGKRETTLGRPIIADRTLKQATERHELPLSMLFLCYALIMALLEAEGVLDRLKMDSLMPHARNMSNWFRLPANAAMAAHAINQPTPAERLFFAVGLYGRLDPFDNVLRRLGKPR